MKIRFADTRPSGDYALVLPAAGKNRIALDSLGAERARSMQSWAVSGLKGSPAARPSCSFQPMAGFGAL